MKPTHLLLTILFLTISIIVNANENPFDVEMQTKISVLQNVNESSIHERARAAEALGYMRAYRAENALVAALADDAADVRRCAVLSLAWCGSRFALKPLLQMLNDSDWTVRQSTAIALENLTGMNFKFDALDNAANRKLAATRWENWVNSLPENTIPNDVLALITSSDHCEATRGLRAVGALGMNAPTVTLIAETLETWRKTSNEKDADAKIRVQSAIRALGRSGVPEAFPVLCDFLYNPQWTRYAADALGDFGGDNAASVLMDVFPQHARQITDKNLYGEHIIKAQATHPSDVPHLDSRDRILAAPYAILFSLSRITFNNPQLTERLKQLAPLIAQQIPLDIDRLVFYEEEPFQKIFRSLLIRAGEKDKLLEHAFTSLDMKNIGNNIDNNISNEIRDNVHKLDLPTNAVASPILHGGDEPFNITCDVNGWNELYLVVDSVENYSMDRTNWADAKLTDAAGETVYLDTLKPVSAEQQHDTLKLNASANFTNIRIGKQQFSHGLHTHAVSVIHYKLDGKHSQFSAQTGVCASRKTGEGSVRFIVSPTPVAITVPLNTLSLNTLSSNTLPSDTSFNSNLMLTLCREPSELPRIIPLLDHPNHWVRINAAKTLLFIGDKRAVSAIRERLASSKREGDYGEFAPPPYNVKAQGQDEFNDPTPRDREALIMSLGGLQVDARDSDSVFVSNFNSVSNSISVSDTVALLIRLLNDDKNSLGIRHRSALALDKIGSPKSLAALQEAERHHPYHSVRIAAREALWRHNVSPLQELPAPEVVAPIVAPTDIPQRATKFVFIKGDILPDNNPFQMDSWRQSYMTTDSGPTYRPGRNLFVLDISNSNDKSIDNNSVDSQPIVRQLTNFADGYVADCEVSYDGKTVWFSRREQTSAWWHIFCVNADGSNLQQVTHGPYHDVQPVELPNGRIAFSSSRLGTRDEYHGYLATGLSTMTPDGRDIQVVGFNFGRDAEPSVADDGRILVTRLELFYSRMKTEFNLIALRSDGTQAQTLYGPERRQFWRQIQGGYGNWFAGGEEGGRHRLLRLTQPQPFSTDNILLTTPAGPVLTQGRQGETLLRQPFLREGGNDEMVITTAIRLDDKTLLVAAGKKNKVMERAQFPKDAVALGIYTMDVATGALTLLYNDSTSSSYEARPLHPRTVPPVIFESPTSRSSNFTGTLYAQSVFYSQEQRNQTLGKLLRVVEGLPQVTRHSTQTTPNEYAWKNHGGAFGRDLGIIPLASDGSFAVEVPADRFLSLQVLDSDRNVIGNQLIWMNVRPNENKGCIGCHESPEKAVPQHPMQAIRATHPTLLPTATPFQFQAKAWFKGNLPEEREERQRTVQAANWFGRP